MSIDGIVNKVITTLFSDRQITEAYNYVNSYRVMIDAIRVYPIKGSAVFENQDGFFNDLHNIMELDGFSNFYATNEGILSYGMVKEYKLLTVFCPKTYIDKLKAVADLHGITVEISE